MTAQNTALRRLGTFDLDIVEANPVIFKGKPYLMEYIRNRKSTIYRDGRPVSHFRFRDMTDMKTFSAPFGFDLHLGNAFVKDDHIVVTAVEDWGKGRFYEMESDDMVHWTEPRVILEDPAWEGYNTSICEADGRYVMAFELGKPKELVHVAFTMFFAESTDLKTWRIIPEAVFGRDIYTGAPLLRFHNGFFYFFHLEGSYEEGFITVVARSGDLKNWEWGRRTVLERSQEDRMILPRAATFFTQQQLLHIASAVHINVSDLDMCDYDGRLLLCYSWGNQRGVEFLALAEAACSEAAFCESFF